MYLKLDDDYHLKIQVPTIKRVFPPIGVHERYSFQTR